jgi:TPP-dependent indolepyruvate ferredoxin oxidoreductase alpha subunit
MLWCIAPAPATATAVGQLRLADIKHCVEGALHDVGWDHKDLAHAMGFGGLTRIGLYYRQLRTHGLNFNLLTNDPEFFLHLAIRVCLMLGITKERIAKALGIPYETAEERQARDLEIEARLRRLEQLAGVPAAESDPPAEAGSPDAEGCVGDGRSSWRARSPWCCRGCPRRSTTRASARTSIRPCA